MPLHSLFKKMKKFFRYSYTIIKFFPEYRFDIFGVLFKYISHLIIIIRINAINSDCDYYVGTNVVVIVNNRMNIVYRIALNAYANIRINNNYDFLLKYRKYLSAPNAINIFYSGSKYLNNKNQKYFQLTLLILLPLCYYFCEPIMKHLISIFIFISIINIKIKFFNVGGYTYLLHLYHSPVIVFIYPLLSKYISNIYMLVISQIILSIIMVYLLFLITRRFAVLKILSGQR